MNFNDENGHKQRDEIMALLSIFEENIFIVNENQKSGRFLAHHNLRKTPFPIIYKDEDQANEETIFVKHLPPIELHFELPPKYPSVQAPHFWISCSWLSHEDLVKICSKLDSLWEESRSEILFIWFSFLKEEVLDYLNHSSSLNVSSIVNNKVESFIESVFNSCNGDSGHGSYDKRIVPRVFSSDLRKNATSIVNHLKSFNDSKCLEDFKNSYTNCICCDKIVAGSDCAIFRCYHASCTECVSEYFKFQIQQGNVHMLKCLETKCNEEATPTMIKELVGETLYQRYDELWYSLVLQTMGDVVYCPRKHCQAPTVAEPNSKLAICPKCAFSFCTNCKYTFHGVSPCRMFHNIAERNEILNKYQNASEEGKRALEKVYGKKQIDDALTAFLSEEYISDNTKKCPNCRANIE
ncbi:E3 ubiquitin-protein ligase RNF14-like protein, partial [Leptotrombidium deliense]